MKLARNLGIALVILAGIFGLSACGSPAADVTSQNISTAADNFEINRVVRFINGITDKELLTVEGRCSITDQPTQLEVTCKVGGGDNYVKHFLGKSDNVFYVVEQTQAVYADPWHYRFDVRVPTLIPDININPTPGG